MARHNNARRWDWTMITSWIAVLSFMLMAVFPLPAVAGDAVFYYHNDTTGSPVAVTNSAGTKVWGADYEPFGELAAVVENVPNSQQFLAKTVDPETSLHLFGARYYDGKIGRFLSVDPLLLNGRPASAVELPQRLSLYAYASNNPYRYTDPNGQFLIPVIVAAVAATAFFPSTVNTPQDSADALHNAQTNIEFAGSVLLSEIGGAVTAKSLGILGNAIGARLSGIVGASSQSTVAKGAENLGQALTKENPRNLISTQSRAEMSGSQVKRLTKDMKTNGFDQSKPVDVKRSPYTGRLEIQDGHHRTQAAIRAGIDKIPVRILK